ncbi:baseplate J/gp47 family protein [Paenibacillus sp. sgz500958]|uniref:baseplate J/gp47 family protein n=1 Tax=Paenibacillus sp. sgz500958 TaxID=3242475 RepID=UPI0036D244E2
MYEDQTFEALLERMLARVPEGIDKREGSIIYDALAPAAAEMAQMYVEMDINNNLRFADTAGDEYLDRSIAWSGMTRHEATKAQLRGVFKAENGQLLDVPIGSRFSLDKLNYKVMERLSPGNFRLESETSGAEGNRYFGQLLPIDYITGLSRGDITEVLSPGIDRENDTELYARYQERVSKPVTSGNLYQYEQWAREITGIGRAKAFPLWNGPGTVKLVLLGNDMRAPTPAVVQEVQDYIDPTQDGMGSGVAPIGAVVTVAGAEEVAINITAQVTLTGGATLQQVKTQLEAGAEEYLSRLAFTEPLIRYTRIQNVILDIPSVVDYSNLVVNGGTGNIVIPDGSVAVLGTVTLS